MSGDFWVSSHFRLLVDSKDLIAKRVATSIRTGLSVNELVKLDLYYSSVLHKLARSISAVLRIPTRQQVIATSLVFFKRFTYKRGLYAIDPLLICAGAFYLSCKVEECPVHIRSVVNEMKHLFGQSFVWDAVGVAEFEFYLFEDLEFYTVVYHPYRTLQRFIAHLGLEKQFLQTASFILNDTYRTDLCLLHPPHMIATTALFITSIIHSAHKQSVEAFLVTLEVDMVVVAESAQVLFDLYHVWSDYSDTQVPSLILKLNETIPSPHPNPII